MIPGCFEEPFRQDWRWRRCVYAQHVARAFFAIACLGTSRCDESLYSKREYKLAERITRHCKCICNQQLFRNRVCNAVKTPRNQDHHGQSMSDRSECAALRSDTLLHETYQSVRTLVLAPRVRSCWQRHQLPCMAAPCSG